MGEVRCHVLSAASRRAPCLGRVSGWQAAARAGRRMDQTYLAMMTTAGERGMVWRRRGLGERMSRWELAGLLRTVRWHWRVVAGGGRAA